MQYYVPVIKYKQYYFNISTDNLNHLWLMLQSNLIWSQAVTYSYRLGQTFLKRGLPMEEF